MSLSPETPCVIIDGAPDSYKLKNIKSEVCEALGRKNAVKTVTFVKTLDGSKIPGRFKVELFLEKDMEDLLTNHAELEVETDDSLHSLKITKSPAKTRSFPVKPETLKHSSQSDIKTFQGTTKQKSSTGFDFYSSDEDEENLSTTDSPPRYERRDVQSGLKKPSNPISYFVNEGSVGGFTSPAKGKPQVRQLPPNSAAFRLPKKPVTWLDLMQTNPELFADFENSCVLVQGSGTKLTGPQIATFFERELVGEEALRMMTLLADGVLVVFHGDEDARNVAKKNNLAIEGVQIRLYLKPIPAIYNDRILLKGNFQDNTSEEVKDLLECCTDVPFKCRKLRNTDMYLVVFDKPIDPEDLKKEVGNLSLSDISPEAITVCRTDCIKVENIKQGVKDDAVKLRFMNKTICKGDVTWVEKNTKSNSALVYFANYKDTEEVIRKSKSQEISVAKAPVVISSFCTGINGSLELSGQNIYTFQHKFDVETNAIKLIQKVPQLLTELYKEIGDLAKVEFLPDPEDSAEFVAKIKPLNAQKQSEDMEQEKFEAECQKRIQKFFKKFATKSQEFPMEDKDRVRDEMHWSNEENYVEIPETSKTEQIKVFVSWNDGDREGVKVTGLPKQVDSFLGWFDQKCSFVEQRETYSDREFRILLDVGLVDETSEYFRESVKINVDKDAKSVTFEGSRDSVVPVVRSLKHNLERVREYDVSFLQLDQKEFLMQSLSSASTTESIRVVKYIRDKLHEDQIQVAFLCEEGQPKLMYTFQKKAELERAKNKIKDLIKYRVMPFDGGYDDVIGEEEWTDLRQKVHSTGTLHIFESRKTSSVTLVGLPLSFDEYGDKVASYFEENVEKEEIVQLPYAKTQFISSFPNEFGIEAALENKSEWFEELGGIHLKGRACHVRKAKSWIEKEAKLIVTSVETLYTPGMSQFLRLPSGSQFLKTASKENICVIQLDTAESPEWNKAASRNSASNPVPGEEEGYEYLSIEETIQEAQEKGREKTFWDKTKKFVGSIGTAFGYESPLTPQQEAAVKVSVIQGDILRSNCDVMINTTGPEFDLTLSQLSSKLIKLSGGTAMIDECKSNPLYQSKVFRVTSAPNTPFKQVIHLVSPNTPDKIASHLQEAFKVMEDDMKLRSLAVPAIGTGQIGLADIEVAKSIKKAIDAFKRTNPKHLKKIDVVVYDTRMVPAFRKGLLGSPGGNTSEAPKKFSVQRPGSSVDSSRKVPAATSHGSVKLSVISGDILSSNRKVMVNTTGNDFNLSASQLSAKLLQKGGRGIENECRNQPIYQSNSFRVTSGGSTKFHNIVHFITPNDYRQFAIGLEETLNYVNDTLKKKSIAIPAIGTGNANLKVSEVTKAMGQAIRNFESSNPKYLTTIDVVIYDKNMLQEFQSNVTLAQRSAAPVNQPSAAPTQRQPKDNMEDKPTVQKSRLIPLVDEEDERHAIKIYLTSNDVSNCQKAWMAITEKAKSKCSSRLLRDSVLEILTDEDMDEIMGLEREFNICVRKADDRSDSNELLILGLKNNVMDAYAYALKLLQKYNMAITTAEFVIWQYQDANANTWEKFPLLANLELESAHKEDKTKPITISMKIGGARQRVDIDFQAMTKTLFGSQNSVKIKRVAAMTSNAYPPSWLNSKHLQLVTLNTSDPTQQQEYNKVLQPFLNTKGNVQINPVKIERIENRRLYSQFIAQKNFVEARMTQNGTIQKQAVTQELFHGTDNDTCEKIYKGGFNRSYAGKNATVWGNGVYFATTSHYSNGYSAPNPNTGEKKMFLADVVTGEHCVGRGGLLEPPQRPNGGPGDLYDSVTNNTTPTSMFVVFKDASVYPKYLLTYK